MGWQPNLYHNISGRFKRKKASPNIYYGYNLLKFITMPKVTTEY
jgi:hypothetical protein